MGTQDTTGANEIETALQAVISEEDEDTSTSEETGTEGTEESATERKTAKSVPYGRFKDVIDTKNELQSQLEAVTETQGETLANLNRTTAMLESAQEQADIVKSIRELQSDPDMLPHLEAIDKRLRGVEEEVEEELGKDATPETRATHVLQRQQDEMLDELADQRSTLVAQQADSIADKWLEELPEEYTDQDRKVISRLWADSVDFDDLEAAPENMTQLLFDSFQETVNDFGPPRGGLINPDDPDSYEIEYEETPQTSPEDELMEIIQSKDYGKINETDGKLEAEVSDADFSADLATLMKLRDAG